jgi:hypothetical protein
VIRDAAVGYAVHVAYVLLGYAVVVYVLLGYDVPGYVLRGYGIDVYRHVLMVLYMVKTSYNITRYI